MLVYQRVHELDTWWLRKNGVTLLQQKLSCRDWTCVISSAKMTGDVCCATIPFSSAALRGGELLYLVLLVTWIRGACGSCARSGSSSINGKCSTTWVSPVVSDYGWPLSIGEPQHQLRGSAVNVFYVNCFGGLGPQRLLSQPPVGGKISNLLQLQLRRKQSAPSAMFDALMVMTYMTVHGWNPAQDWEVIIEFHSFQAFHGNHQQYHDHVVRAGLLIIDAHLERAQKQVGRHDTSLMYVHVVCVCVCVCPTGEQFINAKIDLALRPHRRHIGIVA